MSTNQFAKQYLGTGIDKTTMATSSAEFSRSTVNGTTTYTYRLGFEIRGSREQGWTVRRNCNPIEGQHFVLLKDAKEAARELAWAETVRRYPKMAKFGRVQ